MNISKIANVKQYFPNLAEVTMLDENEPLPFMHEVYRAKIVWTVVYKGVVGEVSSYRMLVTYMAGLNRVGGVAPNPCPWCSPKFQVRVCWEQWQRCISIYQEGYCQLRTNAKGRIVAVQG